LTNNVDGGLEERKSRHRITLAAGALFLAMLSWAFAAPLGSTHDEWLHLGSIWCANGVDGTDCLEFNEPGENGYYTGVAAIEDGSCFLDNAAEVARCKPAVATSYPANLGLYPSSYYKAMNLFVTSHPTLSVLAMRMVNGLLAVALLVGVLVLSKHRVRLAWLTGYVFTLLPMTMFLTVSVHPSGWAITGVGTSWIFLHNAITGAKEDKKKRYWSIALWAISALIVFASRYDAFMFLLFSNFVVVVVAFNILRRLQVKYFAAAAVIGGLALYLTSRVNGMVSWIFDFPLDQREGMTKTSTWISHWLVQTLWVPVQSLGVELLGQGLPGQYTVRLPGPVWIIGIALLGGAMLISFIKPSIEQLVFLIISYLLVAFVVLSFNGRLERDLFNLSGRYVLPIISFTVGFSIFLSSNTFQMMQIRNWRIIAIALLTVVHALSLHAVIETNVDGQSHSVEVIHVGSDAWWWAGLPFGPNFVLLVGSIAFSWFLINVWSTFQTVELTYETNS
jgi:hypothetical protein